MNNISKNDFKILYNKLKKISNIENEINNIKNNKKSNNQIINNLINKYSSKYILKIISNTKEFLTNSINDNHLTHIINNLQKNNKTNDLTDESINTMHLTSDTFNDLNKNNDDDDSSSDDSPCDSSSDSPSNDNNIFKKNEGENSQISQYINKIFKKEDNDSDITPYINKLLEKNNDEINDLIQKLITKINLKLKNIDDREKKLEESKNKILLFLKTANNKL